MKQLIFVTEHFHKNDSFGLTWCSQLDWSQCWRGLNKREEWFCVSSQLKTQHFHDFGEKSKSIRAQPSNREQRKSLVCFQTVFLRMNNTASYLTITSLCFHVLFSAWGKHWVILANENTHTQKSINLNGKKDQTDWQKAAVFPWLNNVSKIEWIRQLFLLYLIPHWGKKSTFWQYFFIYLS